MGSRVRSGLGENLLPPVPLGRMELLVRSGLGESLKHPVLYGANLFRSTLAKLLASKLYFRSGDALAGPRSKFQARRPPGSMCPWCILRDTTFCFDQIIPKNAL
jgi:hypothetical protein